MHVEKLSNKRTTVFGCTVIKEVSRGKPPGLEKPKKSFWFVYSHNNKCCLSPNIPAPALRSFHHIGE